MNSVKNIIKSICKSLGIAAFAYIMAMLFIVEIPLIIWEICKFDSHSARIFGYYFDDDVLLIIPIYCLVYCISYELISKRRKYLFPFFSVLYLCTLFFHYIYIQPYIDYSNQCFYNIPENPVPLWLINLISDYWFQYILLGLIPFFIFLIRHYFIEKVIKPFVVQTSNKMKNIISGAYILLFVSLSLIMQTSHIINMLHLNIGTIGAFTCFYLFYYRKWVSGGLFALTFIIYPIIVYGFMH